MSERTNIHDQVAEICQRLGLTPANVQQLQITPGRVTARIFVLDESGKKFVNPDTDVPAVETHTFEVKA